MLLFACFCFIKVVIKTSSTDAVFLKILLEVDFDGLKVLSNEEHIILDLLGFAFSVVHHRNWCLFLDNVFFLLLLLLNEFFLGGLTLLDLLKFLFVL